jgi:hypothetical protein
LHFIYQKHQQHPKFGEISQQHMAFYATAAATAAASSFSYQHSIQHPVTSADISCFFCST